MQRNRNASQGIQDKGPLKFGLNIVSKKAKISQNIKRNASVFQQDDEAAELQKTGNEIVNEELKRIQERTTAKSTRIKNEAIEQDAQVFDYDSVYDELKAQELYQKRIRDGDDGSSHKKARYMADLIKSANARKLYLEKAAERKLQKEREEEGGIYGEKEEFVTEAYLEKQRELKRLEEEQKLKDELEADPHRQRDMTGFYRDLLEKKERKPPLVLGDKSMKIPGVEVKDEKDKDHIHDKPLPSGVVLNDNLEVVDKRQLLSGGLNLTSKAIKKKEVKEREEELKRQRELDREKRETEKKRQDQLRIQRERNREYVMSQKDLVDKEQRERKEKEDQEKREILLKSAVTQDSVSDARARFLARKAAAVSFAKTSS